MVCSHILFDAHVTSRQLNYLTAIICLPWLKKTGTFRVNQVFTFYHFIDMSSLLNIRQNFRKLDPDIEAGTGYSRILNQELTY